MALLSACAISVKAEEASCVVTAVCVNGEKPDGQEPDSQTPSSSNERDSEGHRREENDSDDSNHSEGSGSSKDYYNIQPVYIPVIDREAIPTYVIDQECVDSKSTANVKSNVGNLPNQYEIAQSLENKELIRYSLVYIKDADRVTEKSVYSFFIEEIDNRI